GAASSIQQSDRFFVEQLEQMGYEIADRIWCQLMIRLYFFFFYVIKIGELERFPQIAVGTILFDTYESLSQSLKSCGIRIALKQTVRLFYKCIINFFHLVYFHIDPSLNIKEGLPCSDSPDKSLYYYII